jgi:hypothetical protein
MTETVVGVVNDHETRGNNSLSNKIADLDLSIRCTNSWENRTLNVEDVTHQDSSESSEI